MRHLLRLSLAALVLSCGFFTGCATKTDAKDKDDAYERPYEWVEIPGSRVRKKVYVGETYDGGPAPSASISKRALDNMQNATRAPAGGVTP